MIAAILKNSREFLMSFLLKIHVVLLKRNWIVLWSIDALRSLGATNYLKQPVVLSWDFT